MHTGVGAFQEPGALRVRQVFQEAGRPKRIGADDRFYYVLSGADHSILVYDRRFRLIRRIGRIGSGVGELFGPEDMSVTSRDLWVADSQNNRIQQFSLDGRPLSVFGAPLPWSIAAIGDDAIAVVGRSDPAMIRVYTRNGQLRRTIDDFVETSATSAFQRASFNRGRVFPGPSGSIVHVFRGLLDPCIRWYDGADGRRLSELRIAGSFLPEVVERARKKRSDAVAQGKSNVTGTLNGFTIDPERGDIWVAPSAPVIYRYDSRGKKLAEYVLRDIADRPYGAHDILVTPSRQLLMISSAFCLVTEIPE